MASSSDRLLPGVPLLFSLSAQLVPESAPSTVTVLALEERSGCSPAKSRLSGEETENNNNKNKLKHILAEQQRPLFMRRRKQVHPPPLFKNTTDGRTPVFAVRMAVWVSRCHHMTECDLLSLQSAKAQRKRRATKWKDVYF